MPIKGSSVKPRTEEQLRDAARVFLRNGRNMTRAAREAGVNRITFKYSIDIAKKRGFLDSKPLVSGVTKAKKANRWTRPEKGEILRYIVTSAQNNTRVHDKTWQNLTALADHYGAIVLVSRFTYNTNAYGRLEVKPNRETSVEDLWYDERILPYVNDDHIDLAPGLVFCGEMNTLPTAERPLSGFEAYTGRKSGIFPHVKFAMDSVASGKNEATKFNYTTGTVTLRNYIAKKAGLKADFHHCYGALLVEVDHDGRWFVRQLNADDKGTIHDLDLVAEDGRVTSSHIIEGITWGDVHVERLDPVARRLAWGKGGMLDTLCPKYQFVHDVLDFSARSHHEMKNPHVMFERYVEDEDSVADALKKVAEFLKVESHRAWCQTVVVNSNHDNHLEKWLREADYRLDPRNALLFLRLQLSKYEAISRKDKRFLMLEHCMKELGVGDGTVFLREDESFVLCRDFGGGVECGMHGDLGPNGSRGSSKNLSKMGRRANIGHSHSAGIHDGVYQAGTTSKLDMGYNRGPSSWSHTHVVTYPNGKRSLVTMWDKRWRA